MYRIHEFAAGAGILAGRRTLLRSFFVALSVMTTLWLPLAEAAAQQSGTGTSADLVRVYVDCRTHCDRSYIRRETPYVDHVRDPTLAEVYVLITDEQTGGGGRKYTLNFTGRDRFAGQASSVDYISGQTDTDFERREGLTETIKIGLVPYLAQTRLVDRLRVTVSEAETIEVEEEQDPWDHWIFEAYAGGNFNVESSQQALNIRYGIYADRVTEEWKIRLRPYFNYNTRTFESGDSTISSVQRRDGFDSYVIKSVSPHWSVGLFGDYITSTFHNLKNRARITPALEYSLFPYSEASVRAVTMTYRIGYEAVDYFEETIYGEVAEGLFFHDLGLALSLQQPWGSIYSSVSGSQYMHDPDHYRISMHANLSLRLVRGLSLNMSTSYQRIHDQLALPKGDATLEEILLQQRTLATSYWASGSIGLSYTFGSIYTNVVNPRL